MKKTLIYILLLNGSILSAQDAYNVKLADNAEQIGAKTYKDNSPNNKYKHFNFYISNGLPFIYQWGVKYRFSKDMFLGIELPLRNPSQTLSLISDGMCSIGTGLSTTNYSRNKIIYFDSEIGATVGMMTMLFSSEKETYIGIFYNGILGTKYGPMGIFSIAPIYRMDASNVGIIASIGLGFNL
jgi:hypothetical protein